MKRWNLIFLLIFALSCSFFLTECKKAPTEPQKKNPREYTWTIDTLAYPGSYQTTMEDMWASSPSDVYVTGHNDGGSGKMYHFNGQSWSPVKLRVSEGGSIPYLGDMDAIFGFSPRDIFAVGFKGDGMGNLISMIIHFDGTKWLEMPTPPGGFLSSVWGSSSSDVWAAGSKGTLLHYNGTSWSSSLIDTADGYMQLFGFSSNQVYLLGVRTYPGPPVVQSKILLFYDGSKWSRIDSLSFPEGTGMLGALGNVLHAAGDGGVYARETGTWTLRFPTPSNVLTAFFSNEERNAFALGMASVIYHYNGQDLMGLNIISGDWWLRDAWCNDREAFIVGHDYGGYKTIVLHGK